MSELLIFSADSYAYSRYFFFSGYKENKKKARYNHIRPHMISMTSRSVTAAACMQPADDRRFRDAIVDTTKWNEDVFVKTTCL